MSQTLFKQVNYTLSSLVNYIELGEIGLPDIQRPFVWKNAKVRDLFDSMYKGYPVGYLLLWQNGFDDPPKTIGDDPKQKSPRLLIVDGQQRLTSLYAVVKGMPVVREDYSTQPIAIAFSPIEEKFEVADAAIRKDRSFIPNISDVWDPNSSVFDLVDDYLDRLRASREVAEGETRHIKRSIDRLRSLESYPFTALELASSVDEEEVADVFVRINSKGTPLNQSDFILTLMSVFWDEGRSALEDFCRRARSPTRSEASPYNHFIEPSPDQLLRASIGLGFKRARLQHVYSILRGKDLETGAFSETRRDEQFEVLKDAQARVLNIQHWHDFFAAIRLSGYHGGRLISSDNNLIFAYILYLMGRTEFGVPEHALRAAIARWFYMSSLTGRFTGSPESAMEFDLARFRRAKGPDQFLSILARVSDSVLTSDFWAITLPNGLAKAAARGPGLFAYYAALVLLEGRGLYSQQRVVDLLDPSVHGNRAAVERHHLFPKGHLRSLGFTSIRETNQIANYAPVEWVDNASIADKSPADYAPDMEARFSQAELRSMYHVHALPDGWHGMGYEDFLERRRELMGAVIAEGYEKLKNQADHELPTEATVAIGALIGEGEGKHIEFKSTLRKNLHTGEADKRIENSALKTIAGFLNGSGGTLVIGVNDDGEALGVEEDGFPNEDKMHLHLINLLRDRMGSKHMMYIHPHFEDHEESRVLRIDCSKARSPVYLMDGKEQRFYLRTGAATSELKMEEAQAFISDRFA